MSDGWKFRCAISDNAPTNFARQVSMKTPLHIASNELAVDYLPDAIKGDIVLELPLGLGNPNRTVSAVARGGRQSRFSQPCF